VELTAAEGRVLGCLVEKELTTPQLYPLTDNALVAACNQTTNRDPVVQYDVATVRLAIRSLREQGLVRTVHRAGERSDKHRHLIDAAWQLSPAQVALLAVLLLRGPQTPGELRARTERMHPFATIEEVEAALEALAGSDEPLVARLDRQPGRKEVRYAQRVVAAEPVAPAAGTGSGAPTAGAAPRPSDGAQSLAAEVAALRAEVAALRAEVSALTRGAAAGADAS
jgi:uncharacterized protein YceH (UPF0502 family)